MSAHLTAAKAALIAVALGSAAALYGASASGARWSAEERAMRTTRLLSILGLLLIGTVAARAAANPDGWTRAQVEELRALVTNGQTGQSVTDAAIAIDGGMPQHGHGLPTRPRVTQNLGDGRYEIGGVRFNMGGWWELKLIVIGPAGTDTVTFNLAL